MEEITIDAAQHQLALDAEILGQPALDPRRVRHHEERHLQAALQREHAPLARPQNLRIPFAQTILVI
jgi:hypothetical protein